jgi:hypothetical protein
VVSRPNDFIIQKELIRRNIFENKFVDSLKEKYDDYFYFDCSFTVNKHDLINGVSVNRAYFSALSQKLNFNLRDYVKVISNKQELVIDDYVLPRLYEVSRSTNFMIAIKKERIAGQNFQIEFNFPELSFINSSVMFNKATIQNTPRLNFYNTIR